MITYANSKQLFRILHTSIQKRYISYWHFFTFSRDKRSRLFERYVSWSTDLKKVNKTLVEKLYRTSWIESCVNFVKKSHLKRQKKDDCPKIYTPLSNDAKRKLQTTHRNLFSLSSLKTACKCIGAKQKFSSNNVGPKISACIGLMPRELRPLSQHSAA